MSSLALERESDISGLLERLCAREAYPNFEHLLPNFFGAGAAEEDKGTRLWTLKECSLSWPQYRFGEVLAN